MKKLVRKIMATVITASMALSVMPVFAEGGDYINIYNPTGIYGGGMNAIGTYANVVTRSENIPEFSSNGFGSKPAGDSFAVLEQTQKLEDGLQLFNNTNITWDEANKNRVLFMELDFVPVEGISAVRAREKWNNLTYSIDLATAKKNDWNHIKFEIDLVSKRSTVELNGEKIRYSKLENNVDWNLMPQMRFQFISDGTSKMTLYSDNVKIYTADSIEETFLNDKFTNDTAIGQYYSFNGISASYVSGAGGKKSDDKSVRFTGSLSDNYLYFDIPVSKKYAKIEYNFMPVSNVNLVENRARNTVLHYSMAGNESSPNADHRYMKLNEWNKVEAIFENKTGYDTSSTSLEFLTALYINGIEVSWPGLIRKSDKYGAGDDYFPYRLGFIPISSGTDSVVMLDDFKISLTNDAPYQRHTFTQLSGSGVIVTEPKRMEHGTISASGTVKLSGLSAEGATVRAYTDNTYASEITGDTALSAGNVVVTEDADGAIRYYDVTAVSEEPEFVPLVVDENFNGKSYGKISSIANTIGTASFVGGVAGKAADDYSVKAVKTTTSQTDIYLEYQAIPSNAEYVTVEYNFLPDTNFENGRIGAKWSNVIGGQFGKTYFNIGRWNNIKYAITNLEPSKSNLGDSCKAKVDVYINGVLAKSFTDASLDLSADGKYQVRFIASAGANDSPMTIYYDDIKINTYKEMPAISMNVPELAIDQNLGIIDNAAKTVLAYSVTTIDDIDAGAFNAVAYTDATFTNVNDGELAAGNVIVISHADNNMLFYYDVIEGEKKFDSISFTYSADGSTFTDALKTDIKNGTYKYTVTATNTMEDNMPVTAIIALYDANGRLVNTAYGSDNIMSGTVGKAVTATLSVTAAAEGMSIKTFVWDTMDNAKPYETGPVKILIIGNSITQHNASEQKGWLGTWGMAASSEDKDYVHRLISKIDTKTKDYVVMYRNISEFEKYFYDFNKFMSNNYKDLADFNADIIIATFGANCNNADNEMDPEFNTPYEFTAKYYENIMNFFNPSGKAKIIAGKTTLTNANVLAQIDAAAASHPEWKLVDMTAYAGDEYNAKSYYKDYPNVFASNVIDGVLMHPGDRGMEAMANDLWNVLPTLIDSVR